MDNYDFSGWATRPNRLCADGRVIKPGAFKDCDGEIVPMCWGHEHKDPGSVLGHALLEDRGDDGVYAYCTFNDTESGKLGRELVKHGDVNALSIWANKLKHDGNAVVHGIIREVSLVLAGANPGAYIDSVVAHGEDGDEEAMIYTDETIVLSHSDEKGEKMAEETNTVEENKDEGRKTIKDIFETLNEEQKNAVYAMVGMVAEKKSDEDDKEVKHGDETEGGDEEMKHNVFDQKNDNQSNVLSHADQEAIIELAKQKNVGSFQMAFDMYMEDNGLQHSIDDIESLFPDYQWVKPGAPEMITRDQTWVDMILNKAHKSPISRIRMRQADVRPETIRAMGYEKTKEKKLIGNINLINRSFDPQTVYVKDKLDRDDIVDITDFDVVEYQRRIMRMALNEELATAILIGDGRAEGEEGKIYETHIRSIWNDDELYTIHTDVDLAAAKAELQGTNTGANFGENYIYAEAIITAALYAREKYKGSGSLDFYCTPHLLNVMLLARDLNGRRIYDSKTDLAAALNVGSIHTVEQFEGKTRKTDDNKTKKLLGLFVNMADYQIGSTKGGQITNFEDFDIDFNQYKYLMETRLSGALTKIFSAIALEEDVTSPEENAAG